MRGELLGYDPNNAPRASQLSRSSGRNHTCASESHQRFQTEEAMSAVDRYLGLSPDGDCKLTTYIGAGKIGMVYRAECEKTKLTWACKIIREGGLKLGWEGELEKVQKLQGVPNVAQYYNHGHDEDREHRPYSWVFFQFVDGKNLRDLLKDDAFELTMSFVEMVLRDILCVLHACSVCEIIHGDLHAGNILVAKP